METIKIPVALVLLSCAMLACGSRNLSGGSAGERKDVKTSTSETGEQTATVDAKSTDTQVVSAQSGSDLEGTEIEIPPGALDGENSEVSI